MDELKRLIKRELDPTLQDQQKAAKQKKGFSTSGVKIVNYLSKNLIEVYEVESGAEYLMEYLTFSNIVGVMGFFDKEIELGNSKLLNGYYLVYDFDNKEIIVYDPEVIHKPIGADLSKTKYEYDAKNQ